MVETFKLIVISILISIAFMIPGFAFQAWLSKMGIVRGTKLPIVIGTLFFVAIKQLWFQGDSWWLWGWVILLGSTLGAHRADFGEAIKHGAWWWKLEEKKKRKRS